MEKRIVKRGVVLISLMACVIMVTVVVYPIEGFEGVLKALVYGVLATLFLSFF